MIFYAKNSGTRLNENYDITSVLSDSDRSIQLDVLKNAHSIEAMESINSQLWISCSVDSTNLTTKVPHPLKDNLLITINQYNISVSVSTNG